jgi:hypothetical protein
MAEKLTPPGRNIVDFVKYQRALRRSDPAAIGSRCCRHCGAGLLDGESEDDCSTAGIAATTQPGWARPPRRFRAD